MAIALGLAPWGWFVVRDLTALLDAVALLLPPVVAAAVGLLGLLAAATRRVALGAVALSWALFGTAAVVGPWVPRAGQAPTVGIRVVEANALGGHQADVTVAEILGRHPDLAVVTELGDALTDGLTATLPHVATSPADPGKRQGEVGVFSRWPIEAEDLPPVLAGQRGLRVVVHSPAGDVAVYALHLDKPTFGPTHTWEVGFRSHRRLVETVRDLVRAESRPTLVVGDLNLSDRTSGYRALRRDMDDALRAGWTGPTSVRWATLPLLARIDHVFMPKPWCAADAGTFTISASDHRGTAVTVGPC